LTLQALFHIILGVAEYLGPVVRLVDDFCRRGSVLPRGSHSRRRGFPASLSELRLARDISDMGQGGGWNTISCIGYSRGVCTWRPSARAFVPMPCRRGVFRPSGRR